MTVLVVEDDAAIRDVVASTLSGEGYDVIFAANGRQALELVETMTPDVILVNYRMPVMNGAAFCSAYRQRFGHRTPLILFTAADDPGSIVASVGADAYLAKPFDLDALIALVRRFT